MEGRFFVSGIGTGVGKTVVAAVLTEIFQADYWKPVQAGDLDESDSHRVRALTGTSGIIHDEAFRLTQAVSPHESAAADGCTIRLEDFKLPVTDRNLIVEGAGGLLVPLNDKHTVIDLIEKLGLPVVLVVRDYLGCINHTLLSLQALIHREIPVEYIIFNGRFRSASHTAILKHMPGEVTCLSLPEMDQVNYDGIKKAVLKLKSKINFNKKYETTK